MLKGSLKSLFPQFFAWGQRKAIDSLVDLKAQSDNSYGTRHERENVSTEADGSRTGNDYSKDGASWNPNNVSLYEKDGNRWIHPKAGTAGN